jgi:hypothetical protein
MLIDLVPQFLAVLESDDREAAYRRYFSRNRPVLEAYWRNYVLEPDGEHFDEVVRQVVSADRNDLLTMLARMNVAELAERTSSQVSDMLQSDVDFDVVLMVGVGAANAGELVVDGRGVAFVCLEHFTGVANPETSGLGLDPELISLWLAHEIAHVVRYTSPTSRSEMRSLVSENEGYYSYWETGRRATLRELLVNEGLAVQAAREASPGHAAWEYFGYGRRQYARIRELEGALSGAVATELDRRGLGLRLRYLSGGMSDHARTIDRWVLPERGGYYLGARLVEPAVAERGLAWAIRARAEEIAAVGRAVATA